jgi:peptidoglycan/LPS O-acetylase OafA/YrhL
MSRMPGRDAVTEPRRADGFRPEIQALRAIAVLLVVVFHLWPGGTVPGGFVGVDVFFVISGFLITAHLVRDVRARPSRYLAQFWARRAARLLPASLLVFVLVGLAGALVLPPLQQRQHWTELLASTLYVENLQLIRAQSEYLTALQSPSAFQHAWSLSVEEQFYLLWPFVILALAALALRVAQPAARRRVVASGLLLVVLGSLAWSVVDTGLDQSRAYFSTFTRMHEFALGGLLSVAGPRVTPAPVPAALLRWGGIGTILATAVLLTNTAHFPGYLAIIPCLATVAVIAAGSPDAGAGSPTPARHDPLGTLLGSRPVQWVGDASYSIYLWHWPLIVLLPYAGISDPAALALVAVVSTAAFGAWSRHFVEVPAQRVLRSLRPRMVAAALSGAVAVTALVGLGGAFVSDSLATNRKEFIAGPCVGAAAAADRAQCGDPFLGKATFEIGPADVYNARFEKECRERMPWCWPSSTPAPRVVALVGDSHAIALYSALAEAARERGWQVAAFVLPHCLPSSADVVAISGNPVNTRECAEFLADTERKLRDLGPGLIVTTGFTTQAEYAKGSDPVAGFTRIWRHWLDIAPLVAVRDNPLPPQQDTELCISPSSPAIQQECTVPRGQALLADDPIVAAGHQMTTDRFRLVDLTDLYCGAQDCYPVVGGVPVYYDVNHINGAFSRSIAGPLGAAIAWPSGR